MAKLIPLHRKGGPPAHFAIVDDADFGAVGAYRWFRNSNGYAVRNVKVNGRWGAIVPMHRYLLGLSRGDGVEVDHRNRDKLDNRRENLAVGTHAENTLNVVAQRTSTSPYRAVHWAADKQRWRARPRLNGTYTHLGYFDDERAAGIAVQRWFAARGVVVELPPA